MACLTLGAKELNAKRNKQLVSYIVYPEFNNSNFSFILVTMVFSLEAGKLKLIVSCVNLKKFYTYLISICF